MTVKRCKCAVDETQEGVLSEYLGYTVICGKCGGVSSTPEQQAANQAREAINTRLRYTWNTWYKS